MTHVRDKHAERPPGTSGTRHARGRRCRAEWADRAQSMADAL